MQWDNPPTFEGSFYWRLTDLYRDHLAWWNRLYHEGLVDHDLFELDDLTFQNKITDGEYAALTQFDEMKDMAGARKTGQERGYGYRYLPVFYGKLKDVFYNKVGFVPPGGFSQELVVTRSVSDKDLPKVLKWIDWYMSEEHDLLAYWGLPSWYTGTGSARRYKAGYTDLENWAAYGKTGGKDGDYFGLVVGTANASPYSIYKTPLSGISLFNPWDKYPEAPCYVYPKDPRKAGTDRDILPVCRETIGISAASDITFWTKAANPMSAINSLPETQSWDQAATANGVAARSLVVKMIKDPISSFDRYWKEYLQVRSGEGAEAMVKAAEKYMRGYYPTMLAKRFTF